MRAAALLMAASVFLSRFMGLIRDKIISWQFGAGADTDVYFAAFVVPDFINHLMAGGYVSITLIPLLSGCFNRDENDAWDFFSTIIFWNLVGSGLLTGIGWICADELARWTAPGFSEDQLQRLSLYLEIILPGQIFFLTGACLTALLYIRKAFTVPALTPLIYNGSIILGGLLWPLVLPVLRQLWGNDVPAEMTGYAAGVSIGAGLGSFLLPLRAALAGGLHLHLRWHHPLLKKYILLALPLALGQSVVLLDEQLVRIFGSLAGKGAVSLLTYARRIMLVPVGVVAQAAGVASFPFLAGLAARNDRQNFDTTLHSALQGSILVILPLTALLAATAIPVLGIIFEGGRFGTADTIRCAGLLQILLVGVPFWAVQQVIGRAFYAWQDTLTPAVIGTLLTVAILPVYALLASHAGSLGVAITSATSILLYALILAARWRKRFGGGAFEGILRPSLICLVLSILSGLAAHAVCLGLGEHLSPQALSGLFRWCTELRLSDALISMLGSIMAYGLCLCAGCLVFLVIYALLARHFLPEALHMIRRRKN